MASPARQPRPRSRRRGGATAVGGFVIGLVAVTVGFLFAGTGHESAPLSAAADAAEHAAAVRLALDASVRPSAAPPSAASATPQTFASDAPPFSPRMATRIVIPSVGIDTEIRPVGYVFAGGQLQYDVPRRAAGEYVTGAQAGHPGNTVIGGHVSLRGSTGVFAGLPSVVAGDVVEVYRGAEVYRYSITGIRVVAPDATYVMSQTQDATLTLITCFPGENYRDRLVVTGRLL